MTVGDAGINGAVGHDNQCPAHTTMMHPGYQLIGVRLLI
jgi:hypothetical protein